MKRRTALCWLALSSSAAGADTLDALRAGRVAVLLRHAETDPGAGDPPGFRLEACSTQRNLSEAGRAQSRRIGAWFAARQLVPVKVRTSPWCRCIDTARLAFGSAEIWPPLASTFADPQRREPQSAALADALVALPARGFEVWVTHQVNVGALTGAALPMGHALVVRGERGADGSVAIRILDGDAGRFAALPGERLR